jgi:hypothetical protein
MATVKQLIDVLKRFPGDAEVIIHSAIAERYLKLDVADMIEYFDFTGYTNERLPLDVKESLGSKTPARKIVFIDS